MGPAAVAPLVGREQELAAVSEALDALPGRGSSVLLEGEAGMGKTTVWRAAVHHARDSGHVTLESRPGEAETALPFAGLSDLLEPVLDDALRPLPFPQRTALEIALLHRDPASRTDRRAIAAGVLSALRGLAPVVVAIDDIQWLDRPTADVLAFALRRLEEEPVTFVGARRTGVSGGLAVRPSTPTVHLSRLGADDLREIVEGQLGLRLRRPALARLVAASDGNPFYAIEIARASVDSGGELALGEATPLPPTLGDLLRRRVLAAPTDVRRLLLLAAAMSTPSIEALERAGIDGETFVRASRLALAVVDRRTLRFSHPLIGSAAYDVVTPSERREAHRSLAETLADHDERALHLALGTGVPHAATADALEAAARRASARGAPETAAWLAEHALALTPAGEAADRHRRTIEAAQLGEVTGESASARALLEAHVARLDAGPQRAEALYELALLQWHEPEAFDTSLEQALDETDDPALRARALLVSSHGAGNRGDRRRAEELNAEAVRLASNSGDARTLAQALEYSATIRWARGEGIDAPTFIRAHTIFRPDVTPTRESQPLVALGGLYARAGEFERARPLLLEGLEQGRRFGDERYIGEVLADLALLEIRAGNAEAAECYAAESVQLVRRVEAPSSLGYALWFSAFVALRVGRLSDAHAEAAEALECSASTAWELLRLCALDVIGGAALAAGDARSAVDHLEPALDGYTRADWREPCEIDLHANLVEAYVGLGEIDRGEALTERFMSEAVQVRSHAQALRCRGLIAAARGATNAAVDAFERSLAVQAQLPEPYETGRTLLALGSLWRRTHQKRAARDALEGALRELEACHATAEVRRARDELARIGGRTANPSELTATEAQIAALVADGRSNDEIGRALHITRKTVEWNLTKVYRKLLVATRTELAVKLSKRQS